MSFSRVRVKFCGFTQEDQVSTAVRLGADAIGFVLYEPSKRNVAIATAALLRRKVPAFVSSVSLFVNPEASFVREAITKVQPDLLQFHGDESAAFCESFNHPYMKAFRVGGPHTATADQVLEQCLAYQSAKAWLFDSYSPQYGGTGVRFDLSLLKKVQAYSAEQGMALVLAGGLNEHNVAQAISDTAVFAVDVSSGIESAPGHKLRSKMHAFLQAVQSVQ